VSRARRRHCRAAGRLVIIRAASRAGSGQRWAWRRRDKGHAGHEDHSGLALTRERTAAWGQELSRAHQQLRARLSQARADLAAGRRPGSSAGRLTLDCAGFCRALARHHGAEDRALFPQVLAAHPGLARDVALLITDHRLLAGLIRDLEQVAGRGDPAETARHLDGIEAIMESHFAFEERRLAAVLDALALDAEPADVLGVDTR
jgi:hypothetical protein